MADEGGVSVERATGTDLARIVVAVAIVISLSSAPFVQLSTRVLHLPLDASTWAYVYPYFGTAIAGVALKSESSTSVLWARTLNSDVAASTNAPLRRLTM